MDSVIDELFPGPIECLVAQGRYNYANSSFTTFNFPTSVIPDQVTTYLVEIPQDQGKAWVDTKMAELGMDNGNAADLFAHGKRFPDEQRIKKILAFGQLLHDDFDSVDYVPCLDGCGVPHSVSGREANLYRCLDSDTFGGHYALGIKRSPVQL